MSLALALLAAVCAVNPIRARAALPDEERGTVAALAAAATLGVLVGVAALAGPLVDGLDLTAPTVRMAAGALLAVQGAAVVLVRPPAAEPRLRGRAAALVPVAFPVLLSPGLGVLTLSLSLDRSAPTAAAVLAAALAGVPLVALVGVGGSACARARLWRAAGATLGAALVVAGLALVADGLFDI